MQKSWIDIFPWTRLEISLKNLLFLYFGTFISKICHQLSLIYKKSYLRSVVACTGSVRDCSPTLKRRSEKRPHTSQSTGSLVWLGHSTSMLHMSAVDMALATNALTGSSGCCTVFHKFLKWMDLWMTITASSFIFDKNASSVVSEA